MNLKSLLRIMLRMYDYAVFHVGLAWFGLQALCWSLVAMVLHPLLPRAEGQAIGRGLICNCFRLYLKTLELSGRFRFDLDALDALRDEKSLIIAPNHPSLWDAVLMVSRLPHTACIMKGSLVHNIFLGAGARLARYIRNESARQMIAQAAEELQQGNRILLFPEGTRTMRTPVNPLKGSIGIIARRAQAPVQTVFIETDSPFLTKGWPLFRLPPMPIRYRVRLGRRFPPPENSATLVAELEQYFASELGGAQRVKLPAAPDDATPGPAMATD